MDNANNQVTLTYQITTTEKDTLNKSQDEQSAAFADVEFSFIEQRNLVF